MDDKQLRASLIRLLAMYRTLATENHAMSRVLDEDRTCNWKPSYRSFLTMAQQSFDADASGLEYSLASESDPLTGS